MKSVATMMVLALTTGLFLRAGAQSLFGTNLIVNGNAEAGPTNGNADLVVPVPGWTDTTGSFTVCTYGANSVTGGVIGPGDPGPANRGLSFFSGGYNGAVSTASQTVDVSAYAGAIDAQVVAFFLVGWFGGWASQDDNAALSATFVSSNGIALGSVTIGGVLAADRNEITCMLERSTNGLVPVGTRTIELEQTMTRFVGSYNDGYADNLGLVLNNITNSTPSLTIESVGHNVVITWPDSGGAYTLEATPNLQAVVWKPLTNEMFELSGRYYVTDSISGFTKYYRVTGF